MNKQEVLEEIQHIKHSFKNKWNNAFFQLGLVNEMISFDNVSHRSEEFKADMKQMRLNLQKFIGETYGVKTAFRENMPQSDIIIDLSKTDEQLLSEMNSGCKQRIKKATGKGLEFHVASPDQYDSFYQ